MKQKKVITNFSGFSEPKLETLGDSIVTAMTGNVHFPELADEVILAANAVADFRAARAAAATGGKETRSFKNQKKGALREGLHDIAVKVNLKAKGNEVMLDSTAIPFTKDPVPAPVGPLERTGKLTVDKGPGHGALAAEAEEIEGARAYLFQITKAPVTAESVWENGSSLVPSYIFYGLTVGGVYAIRVAGIGKDPNLIYSDAVVSHVM